MRDRYRRQRPHPFAFADALRTDPDQQLRSAYMTLFRQPAKAEQLLLADGARRLRTLFDPLSGAAIDGYVAHMQQPGALTAALSWYRAMSGDDLRGMGPVTTPTLYVWSTGDPAQRRVAGAPHVERWRGQRSRLLHMCDVAVDGGARQRAEQRAQPSGAVGEQQLLGLGRLPEQRHVRRALLLVRIGPQGVGEGERMWDRYRRQRPHPLRVAPGQLPGDRGAPVVPHHVHCVGTEGIRHPDHVGDQRWDGVVLGADRPGGTE